MEPFFDNLGGAFDGMFQGAFPDDSDTPAKLRKHFRMPHVSFDVPLKFLSPEIAVGLGRRCIPTALVSVPKAAVDEYYSSVFWKHKVGRSRKGLHMKAIPETLRKEAGTESPFGPRILCPDTRHHATSLRSGWNTHGHESCQPIELEGKSLCKLNEIHRARYSAGKRIMNMTRAGVQGGR